MTIAMWILFKVLRTAPIVGLIYLLYGCDLGHQWDRSGSDQSRLLFFPDVLANPISVLSQSDNDVIAVMKADKLHLSAVQIDGEQYWRARIAGFETRSGKGAPEIPHVTVRVKVPRNAEIKYRILDQYRNEGIKLSGDLSFESRLPIHGGDELFAKRDDNAYRIEYAMSPISIEEVSYSANEKIAVIKFMPLYYDASRSYVQLTKYLKVHFYFQYVKNPTDGEAPVSGSGPGPLSRFYINKSDSSDNNPVTQRQRPIDLIIAADVHRTALARYLDFKRSIGRQVIDKYVSGQSASQIKDMIAQAYQSPNPPSTTMLVGHIGQIPSFRGSGDNSWTDWNYTLLDPGTQPDVALGRVPAHSADELNIFIDKAIARETGKRNVDQILLTSGKDSGMRCSENASEVGRAIASGNNNINMTHHSKLHGASQSTVIEGYNSNPNFIVYDGHGYQQGMTEIPLLIRDLDKLRNTSYPIILDIACLNANWSAGEKARNFAESILFSKSGGAAGILASGGSGYGHNFFRDIGKIMAATRNSKGSRNNEIGHLILSAKSNTSSIEDKSYWNYYGDPASSVWESNIDPSIVTAPDSIFVKLGNINPSRPVIYGASNNNVDSMAYCVGSRKVCDQSSSYLAMAKVDEINGMKVFKSNGSLDLVDMMNITIWAKSQAGVIKQTVLIRRK
jgi:hypothetical protein